MMGYCYYEVKVIEGDYRWIFVNDISLGLLKNLINDCECLFFKLFVFVREEVLSDYLFILMKINLCLCVYCLVYMDYVGVKVFNKDGNVVGEYCFLGLYFVFFYNMSVM